MRRFFTITAGISLLFTAQVNASYQVADTPDQAETIELNPDEVTDPFEGFNRAMYEVNQGLDTVLIRPLSIAYSFIPNPARKGVRNVLTNLRSPLTFVNDLLQLNPMRAGETFVRTFINTTLGLGGIFDVATEMGVGYHSEDFGQTLGVAGIGHGPYLVLPILGPTTARDLAGTGVDTFINPVNWYWTAKDLDYMPYVVYGVDGIDRRTEADAFLEELKKAIDPYARVRSLYLQSRRYHINNEAIDETDSPKPVQNVSKS